ncbi:peptidylprolyl isomerase [Ilyomonas limi]|uniref:Peptidylprolyl isomerase n=2 Tax=Ilyomonas limi TaxID=2575867 RepID=A0A4U3L9S3_9BACT|nr:peptidylprolyl isomerase [Ilyomonas limi]
MTAAHAQQQKVVADKIIAQVGDKIILQSDITNAIADYKRQGQDAQLPPNPECAFLEGQLIQKALVLQAERDSLPISDEDLDARLDNQIRGFIQSYGSKEALEEIAGKTIYQIKEDNREPFKERLMADQMRSKILESVKITPTEVKAYFDKIPKDSLPYFESKVEVSQVVLNPKANKDVEEYVSNQLLDLKRQVETGGKKFADLARIYTQDPGSKENGGQYSINRNDKQWDPAFMAAVWRLKEGQISPVVKSRFGLHIIQMVSRAGDDAIIRHILIIPPVTDAEVNIAKARLDSIRTDIVNNKIAFAQAVNKYSDDENGKFTGGAITDPQTGSTLVTIDQLDKDLVVELKDMKPGDVSQPIAYTDERGMQHVRIVYFKTRTEPHVENMKDDYSVISNKALEEKKMQVLEQWFKTHIPTYYIHIDNDYSGCSSIRDWWNASNMASNQQ